MSNPLRRWPAPFLVAALSLQPLAALACDETAGTTMEQGASVSVGRIADLTWVVTEVAAQPVADTAGLSFSVAHDGAITGNGGCNSFAGHADLDAGVMTIGPLLSTRMACDEDRMALEARYLKALEQVRWFVLDTTGHLRLQREDGSLVLCLRP